MLKDKIKQLCREHGTSVPKLENELGLSSGSISKWDKSSPKADNLKKVADYFGVSIDYLMDTDTEFKPVPPDYKFDLQKFSETSPGEYETTTDELIKKAMDLFSQMDEEHKKTALAQLEALAALNRK